MNKKRSFTFEIDFAILICIEDVDHSLHQRVLLQFGQGHEFWSGERERESNVRTDCRRCLKVAFQKRQLIGSSLAES